MNLYNDKYMEVTTMCLFKRKNKEPEVVEKIVEKKVEVEKKYSEEFIKDFNEFSEYWNERRSNTSDKKGITIKPSMCDDLDRILKGIKI